LAKFIGIESKRAEAIQYFNLNENKRNLLGSGWSLGERMNQLIEKKLENCFSKCSDYLAMRKVIFRRL
jgi:UDP-N-acetylglucosamine--N-acetylmuramyl-(pentapeptide) pyrophosphoryl-undecaprenol N-acetylglucosamine transferase